MAKHQKITENCLFRLVIINILLFLLFQYYQPVCEPCSDALNCPPCLSKQQYVVIYSFAAVNLIYGLYCFFRKKRA